MVLLLAFERKHTGTRTMILEAHLDCFLIYGIIACHLRRLDLQRTASNATLPTHVGGALPGCIGRVDGRGVDRSSVERIRVILVIYETKQGDFDKTLMGGCHLRPRKGASEITWSNTGMRAVVRGGEKTTTPVPRGLILN
jgi:hypothetical protein